MNLDHACNSEHYNETPSTCRTSKIRRREKSEKDNETHRDEEEWFSAEEDCTGESRGEVEGSYSSLQAALETLKNDTSIEEQMEPSASAVTEPSAPDDVLPHELNELHERWLKQTMELYKEQTKQLCEEAVEIYRDALLQTVEKCILELREIAQARMLSLNAVMSEDMRIIYSEMEMSSTYKMMKRDLSWSTTTAEENTTDTSSRFHTAEHNNNIIRPIFAVRSVVTTTPSGYDQSPYLEVNNVNNVSRHFEPEFQQRQQKLEILLHNESLP
ncbi:hypothetical protein B566_EDAN002043 [Ephemera danica]|nr:hypothetical protein B566_EDAN002043 [Ephemera danica]